MLTEKQIKQQIFAAAIDGIRKTAFYDGLHVEVSFDDNKTVAVVRCKVDNNIATYIKISASNMVG
jgi:uncharacterized protein YifN (PemK superfamily)